MALAVVNQTPLVDLTGYGPAQAQLGNATGNTLLAFVAAGSDNVNGYGPRMSVSDDAHNWWIYLGSKLDTFTATVRRVDIWICPNAKAATVVNVSASMLCAGIVGSVVEFTGFPQFAQFDFVSVASGFGTTVTLPGATASGSDWTFSCLVNAGVSNGGIVARPGTTLTPVLTSSATNDMSNLAIYPSYNSCAAGSVPGATYTWTNGTNYSVVTVGVSQAPTPPAQPNPNWPSMKVEAAFGYQPGGTTGVMPTWTDLTSRVYDKDGSTLLTTKRGRDYELTQPEAGDTSIWFSNQDGAFQPTNTSSPFYPNLLPETPVRVSAFWNGRQYGLGYDYVHAWPQNFPDPKWGMSEMTAGDAIGIASQGQMPSAYAGQVLADFPYSYYPLGEYYSAPHGSLFSNLSRTNLKPMVGYSPPDLASGFGLQTGQSITLAGDPSTGIGIQPSSFNQFGGGGAFVRDYSMPPMASGLMLECWVDVMPSLVGTAGSSFVNYLNLTGVPGNYANGNSGQRLVLAQAAVSNGVNLTVQLFDLESAGSLGIAPATVYPFGSQLHVVVTVNHVGGTTWVLNLYVNGLFVATNSTSAAFNATDYNYLVAGPVPLVGEAANATEYTIGQVALYPWIIPAARILEHYNTGNTANGGDTLSGRLGKLMVWSGLGLPFGSALSPPSPLIGNADQIQGSALADVYYALSQDEGGMYYCPATSLGELWYDTRTSLYNNPAKYTFGDSPVDISNGNPGFTGNAFGWLPNSCTQAPAPNAATSPTSSGVALTKSGSPSQWFTRWPSPAQALASYTLTGFYYDPSGGTSIGLSMDWYGASGYISTSSATVVSVGGNWTFFKASGNAPAGTTSVQFGPTVQSGGSATVQFTDVFLVCNSSEIPYLSSDFDFSDTYLWNLVSSQRTVSTTGGYQVGSGGAQQVTYNNDGVNALTEDQTSEAEYFPRGPVQLSIETTSDQDAFDRANWTMAKYKQPQLRANQIVLDPGSNPSIFQVALQVEQGDIVLVNRRPIGAPMISVLCIVQQVQHDVGPNLWNTTLSLAPYFPENAVIQLDNTSFNELGDGVLGW